MTNIEIKNKIEQLRDDKEDIKFEMGKILDYFLGGIIFLATTALMVTIAVNNIFLKLIASLSFIVLIIFMFFNYFKPMLEKKKKEYNEKKIKIQELYTKLKSK